MKACKRCSLEKDNELFIKDKKSKDGIGSWCKSCFNEYKRLKRGSKLPKVTKEQRKIQNHNWWLKNKAKITPNKVKYNKEWYLQNPDKVKLRQDKNKHKISSRARERRRNEPLFRLRTNLSSLIYQSMKARNFTKNSKTLNYIQCSFEDFMKYLGPKPQGKIHLDHICPCSQAQNEEELIKLQHYSNFQWLTAKDNLEKYSNKTLEAEQKCLQLLNRDWIDNE
jgi:hypothetical protein